MGLELQWRAVWCPGGRGGGGMVQSGLTSLRTRQHPPWSVGSALLPEWQGGGPGHVGHHRRAVWSDAPPSLASPLSCDLLSLVSYAARVSGQSTPSSRGPCCAPGSQTLAGAPAVSPANSAGHGSAGGPCLLLTLYTKVHTKSMKPTCSLGSSAALFRSIMGFGGSRDTVRGRGRGRWVRHIPQAPGLTPHPLG